MDSNINSEQYKEAEELVSNVLLEEGLELSRKQNYQSVMMVYDLLCKSNNSKPSNFLISKILEVVIQQTNEEIQ